MIYISHRGNLDSVIPSRENTLDYIDEAIAAGFDVEIDVRTLNNGLYLGHDKADNPVTVQWLLDRRGSLWIHTKDFQSLVNLIEYDLKLFYHEKENHTIIHNTTIIWSHNILEANRKSIIPLLSYDDLRTGIPNKEVYGICSDFIKKLK